MFLYATVDQQGRVTSVHRSPEEISLAQLKEEGALPYSREDAPAYDTSQFKEDGLETVVTIDSVVVRPKVVPKTDADKRADALARRRAAMPTAEEQLPVLATMVKALLAWIDLQVDPNDPRKAAPNVTAEHRKMIEDVIGAAGATPLPVAAPAPVTGGE